MRMKMRRLWRSSLGIAVASAAISGAFGIWVGSRGLIDAVEGAADGFIIGIVLSSFELQVMTAPATTFLRRQPLAVHVLGRLLLYVAVFVTVLVGVRTLTGGDSTHGAAVLGRSLLFSFAMAALFVVGTELRRLLGP